MNRRTLDRLDRWVQRIDKIRPIGEGGYIMRLKVFRYREPRLVLQDGTVVNPGDLVGEFHMENRHAAALHEEGSGGFRFRQEMFRMLPALAHDLCTRPEYRTINAVCGASLFWNSSTLGAAMGFEHRPLPPFTRWWLGWWTRYLLAHYHPEGEQRLRKGGRTELRRVWITRGALLRFAERTAARKRSGKTRMLEEHSGERTPGPSPADIPLA